MRVLLVEDDTRIASFISKGLRENAYAVDTAADGDEAAYMASINPYDLFILDVNLPKKMVLRYAPNCVRTEMPTLY